MTFPKKKQRKLSSFKVLEKIQDKNFLKRRTILELHILHMHSMGFLGDFLMLGFVLN